MNVFMYELNRKAQEQKAIIELMCVFPAYYQYKSKPTFDQMKEFAEEASKLGYTLSECVCVETFMYKSLFGEIQEDNHNNLYHIFTSGRIPDDLDNLIKRLGTRQ